MEKTKNSIGVNVLNTYKDYVDNGYPKDPNIYEIRASKRTCSLLLKISERDYQHDKYPGDEQRFIWFRLKEDNRLRFGEILFGPQNIDIKLE